MQNNKNPENKNHTPSELTNLKIQWLQDAIDCVSIIDIFAKDLLHWLKKQGDNPQYDKMIEDLKEIRKRSQEMKAQIRGAAKELFGVDCLFEAQSRHAVLRTLIIGDLRRMRFFK